MGLFNTVQFREDLPISFENDGFELTPEMREKYLQSKIRITNGQMRQRDKYFCKNASIFDVTGTKLSWGDIAPRDVTQMLGVYYILSEHKSYWNPDEASVKGWEFRKEDGSSEKTIQIQDLHLKI
ncbi:hypothetical protein COV11_01210 [Candidatus Woesearchaeota archaeon CG10_big_fil_rev_8_21_14_0_10_30_7]|nr:MAG: hypothetical protein COV11_01210 [Candidatus Woesearchaeota archaeon CG10_big_fil_rev_8_21_14_0_10_30_7]